MCTICTFETKYQANVVVLSLFSKSSVTDKNVKVFYPLGCFCCCPSGPLEVSAFTPVRGYTPGQIINLKLNVSNASKEPVHKFEVELIKVRGK